MEVKCGNVIVVIILVSYRWLGIVYMWDYANVQYIIINMWDYVNVQCIIYVGLCQCTVYNICVTMPVYSV